MAKNSIDKKQAIKNLIIGGKKEGYILKYLLIEVINDLPKIDQEYVVKKMDELEIQIIDNKTEYDEYKYLTGEEAIKILQSLSDGTHQAFIKPGDKNKKD